MKEQFNDGIQRGLPSIESDYTPPDPACACFRCGDCCRLWVFITSEEADRIAEYAKIPRNEFVIVYWDKDVAPDACLVLQQPNGACLFLCNGKDSREKDCAIYDVRPGVCREFVPSLIRKECQTGLKELWGLTATPSDGTQGSEKQVRAFNSFVRAIVFGQK